MLRSFQILSAVLFASALHLHASAQVAAPLRPYITCHFSDDLAVVQKEPTPPAALGRTAITLTGPKQVPIMRGEKLLFAYPTKSPFVRTTIEQLPTKSFEQGKSDLISAFDKLIASDDSVQRNYMLKPQINGFEAHGLDKKAIGGAVLGIYLLVDDTTRSVVSIDFLNPPIDERTFSSVDDYTHLRDAFLANYTSCARANLHAAATPGPTTKTEKKTATPAKKTAKKR